MKRTVETVLYATTTILHVDMLPVFPRPAPIYTLASEPKFSPQLPAGCGPRRDRLTTRTKLTLCLSIVCVLPKRDLNHLPNSLRVVNSLFCNLFSCRVL